jgi:Ca2+-binding EF-hand superfamily protein
MSISGVGGGAAFMRQLQPPSFSSIDSNASGDITLEELKAKAPGGASDAKGAERAQKLFSAMDADGNGSVTSAEKDAFDSKLLEQRQAMQFMTQQMAGHKPPSNEDIFAATDKDGSGSVSLEEFSASEAAEDISSDELSELFATIDADGDGAITESESSSFLDGLKEAMGGGRPMGPPPGGPPPGGPPPAGGEGSAAGSDEEEDENAIALDLLTAATSAYSSSASSSDDLLAALTKLLDEAA